MKNSLLFLSVSLLVASPVFSQDDLVPATSEDIRNFDSQVPQISPVINPPAVTTTPRESERPDSIEAAHGPDHESGNGRGRGRGQGQGRGRGGDNFGAVVAAEAKRLNDSPKEDRPKLEGLIIEDRKRNENKKIDGDVANGPGMIPARGGTNDARVAAPGKDDHKPDGIEDGPEGSDHTSGRRGRANNRGRNH